MRVPTRLLRSSTVVVWDDEVATGIFYELEGNTNDPFSIPPIPRIYIPDDVQVVHDTMTAETTL